MKHYNFEIYTNNPVTGESGWDIKWAGCFANSKEEAREEIKNFPNFDTIITFNFGGLELEYDQLEYALYNEGIRFFERHSYMNNEIIRSYIA